MGRKPNGCQVQVSGLGYRIVAKPLNNSYGGTLQMEELHTYTGVSGIHGDPVRCCIKISRGEFKSRIAHTKVIGFRWDLGAASCFDIDPEGAL